MQLPPLIAEDPRVAEALANVSVVYTDLDGTLVAKGGSLLADGDGEPSFRTAEAVVAINRAGFEAVPISGRGRLQLLEFVRTVGWCSFIAEAGAVLVHGAGPRQQVIYNNGSWPEELHNGATPYDLIERAGAIDMLAAAFPGRVEYHDPWHLDREATHLLRGCLDADEAQRLLDTLELPIGLLDNGMVRNRGTLQCGPEEHPHAYHLVPKGVSKAQSIALDLESRGLTAKDAAAIGDSATDIQMADSVGIMVLVDNAFEGAGVRTVLASSPRDNVWRVSGKRGDGWAEFAYAWLDARGAR